MSYPMRPKSSLSVLLLLSGAAACSLVVDTDDLPTGDFEDAGSFDASGADAGSPDAGPECLVDVDCAALGSRFRCVRSMCFNLDSPRTRVERVGANIESDTTRFADTRYELGGTIFVRNGAILTVQPGTTITGLANQTALIVTREGMVIARGTMSDPIVFTSGRPVGERRTGDWGGVALLGRAPINIRSPARGEDFLEGLPESPDTTYGGGLNPNPEHSCGTLEFVRIEFAGFTFQDNNELNGLTMAGCGFDTRINHVQVHYGSDDGVEIFGGQVGLRNVVISRAQDDSLDWDQGWTGVAQFVAILQDAPRTDFPPDVPQEVRDRYTGGDRGIEADSLADDDPGFPRSRPRLFNFTMVGSRASGSRTLGMTLREGTSAEMRNFLLIDYINGMWDVENQSTSDCMRRPLGPTCTATNAFSLDGLLLHNMGGDGNTYVRVVDTTEDNGFDEARYIQTATAVPRVILLDAVTQSPQLVRPILDERGPNLLPAIGSPADISSLNPPPLPIELEQLDDVGNRFIGAFEPGGVNWMDGWTSFPDD